MQEEAEDRAAAAERRVRQAQASLKHAEAEAQQADADAQLDGHSATLHLSTLQQSYSRSGPFTLPLHLAGIHCPAYCLYIADACSGVSEHSISLL